jgi:hypothetical protein
MLPVPGLDPCPIIFPFSLRGSPALPILLLISIEPLTALSAHLALVGAYNGVYDLLHLSRLNWAISILIYQVIYCLFVIHLTRTDPYMDPYIVMYCRFTCHLHVYPYYPYHHLSSPCFPHCLYPSLTMFPPFLCLLSLHVQLPVQGCTYGGTTLKRTNWSHIMFKVMPQTYPSAVPHLQSVHSPPRSCL